MKTCFKCQQTLNESEFYKHSRMADGLLGKCKTCTKRDSFERYKNKMSDPEWVMRERERGRIKQQKARAVGKYIGPSKEVRNRSRIKTKEKFLCRIKTQRYISKGLIIKSEICQDCKISKSQNCHHEDYNDPLKVVWLCTACHGKRHRKPSLI